jgi:F420-non-reducing hydrogenase iron-sulfur subunit
MRRGIVMRDEWDVMRECLGILDRLMSRGGVQMTEFTPKIVAFCCRHCAYTAADLAGSLRIQYPPNIKIVEITCTGRLDIVEVLHTFEHGADGVMAAGWLPGDCHYLEGNLNARRRVETVKKLLGQVGLESERIEMFNLSSAMGAQFAQVANEMVQQIDELGPNPLRGL